MRKLQGIALITVLICLLILSIVGLFALESAWMQRKITIRSYLNQINLDQLDGILQQIEQQQIHTCYIPITSDHQLSKQPLDWWQQAGCHLRDTIYYVIEDLGNDPCATINSMKSITARYFRVTLLALTGNSKRMLQSTWVVPDESDTSECHAHMHSVNTGRQMQRLLLSS